MGENMIKELSDYTQTQIKELCGEDAARQMQDNLDILERCIKKLNGIFEDHTDDCYLSQCMGFAAYAGIQDEGVPVFAVNLNSRIGARVRDDSLISFTTTDILLQGNEGIIDEFRRSLSSDEFDLEAGNEDGKLTSSQKTLLSLNKVAFSSDPENHPSVSDFQDTRFFFKKPFFFSGVSDPDGLSRVFTSAVDFEKSVRVLYSCVAKVGVDRALSL